MDIQPAYNCLLGRPWIHVAGAVPSSLHQKVKFIANGQLINVMGEKEMMEALETSFQALSDEAKRGEPKPSKAAIMAAKVLIRNDFEPGKGLGRRLNGIAELVAIQENPNKKIIIISLHIETSFQINNVALTPDDAGKSSRQDEGEDTEEEALKELERLLEQERPKLQSDAEELEVINLGEGEEIKEIWIGELIPPDLKQRLTKLLREYADIFARSYKDMPGLDTTIVKNRLPLIPDAVPIQQQLRRMKPKVALKIKEVEKQWNAGFLAVPISCRFARKTGRYGCALIIETSTERVQRMTFLYPTSTYWWTILLNTPIIPSWMGSPDTTKSRWPRRTKRKLPSSPRVERSVIRSCRLDSKK
ncbi:hypothetical protein CR513_59603, partial [Mucuna pruriens]